MENYQLLAMASAIFWSIMFLSVRKGMSQSTFATMMQAMVLRTALLGIMKHFEMHHAISVVACVGLIIDASTFYQFKSKTKK